MSAKAEGTPLLLKGRCHSKWRLLIKNLTNHPKNLPNQKFLSATSYIRLNSLQLIRQNTSRFYDIDTIPTQLTELANNSVSTTVTS
jgi:hypothetical protein